MVGTLSAITSLIVLAPDLETNTSVDLSKPDKLLKYGTTFTFLGNVSPLTKLS